MFARDNIKNEAILRDFLIFRSWQHPKRSNSARLPSKMESWLQRWRPRANAFCNFSTPPVESTAPATKKWCQVIQSAAPVTQNHLSKPEDLMSLALRLPRKMHLCRSSSNVPRLPSFLETLQNPHVLLTFEKVPHALHLPREATSEPPVARTLHVVFCAFWLRNVLRATTACTFSTSQLTKVVRAWCALYILTSKRASRHNGVHFFDISIRTWCVLCILTWKCASRHNGVHFFISHLASWLRTRRCSEPTFQPSGATNHWKNTVFRDFPTFSRICIFFLLTLSLLWSSLFYSSLLSDSSHLCFSSVHIVGSLTSNLPSTIWGGLHVIDIDTIWLAFWNDGPLIPAWWCENMLCQGQLTATCLVCWPACQTFIVW